MAPKTAMRIPPNTLFFESTDEADEDLEVLDSSGAVLMIMPRSVVFRQGLLHRGVLVGLWAAGRRLMLCRTGAKNRQPVWDVPAWGMVRAGEAREEAALRHLERMQSVSDVSLGLRLQVPPRAGSEPVPEISWFTGQLGKNAGRFKGRDDILLVDAEEMAGLIREVPELISSRVLWLYQASLLSGV